MMEGKHRNFYLNKLVYAGTAVESFISILSLLDDNNKLVVFVES